MSINDIKRLPKIINQKINDAKKGEWIPNDIWYRCSECGSRAGLEKGRVCPHCGKKMKNGD